MINEVGLILDEGDDIISLHSDSQYKGDLENDKEEENNIEQSQKNNLPPLQLIMLKIRIGLGMKNNVPR